MLEDRKKVILVDDNPIIVIRDREVGTLSRDRAIAFVALPVHKQTVSHYSSRGTLHFTPRAGSVIDYYRSS